MCAAFALSSGAAQAIDVLHVANADSAAYAALIEDKYPGSSWTHIASGTTGAVVGGDLDRTADFGTGVITVKAYLDSFDLVIIGNGINSGNFNDGAGGADWAAITKPVIVHSALAARASSNGVTTDRLALFTGGQGNYTFGNPTDSIRASLSTLADGLFVGVTDETDLYDSALATFVESSDSVNTYGGGELITSLTNGGATFHGVAFWDAGTTNAVGSVLAAKRGYFPLRNSANSVSFLTADGQTVLGNLIDELLASAPVIFLPPSGLTAKSGITEIDLSWTATAGAVSYNVKRSLTPGGPYTTISTAGTVTGTTYTDTGLTNGTTYYYVVSAVNGVPTETADSPEASTYPVPVIQPAMSVLYVANGNNAAYQNFMTNGQFVANTWTVKGLGTGTDQIGGDLDRVTDFTGLNGGTGITVKQYLESFDLIIAGLPTTSSAFVDGVNGADWAQIAKPILFNSSFAARSLGGRTAMFFTAANGDGSVTFTFTNPNESVRVSATTLGDAIFAGVVDNTDLYSAASTDTLLGTDAIGGGELISSVTDGIATHYGVVFWNAGTVNGGGQLLFKNRAFMPFKADGPNDLTADGRLVMGNLVNQLMVPTATVFPAPTNLVAKSGVSEIDLTWTGSVGAVSYNVKRSLTPGGPYTTVSTPGAVTGNTYTDTGLTNGTTYYYVVSAVNADPFESVDSTEASTFPVDSVLPGINILYVSNANSATYENFATNGQFSANTWTQKITGTGTAIDQIGGDLDRITDFTGPVNAGTGITVRSYLESFDLIIVGTPTTSINFADLVNGAVWAEITKPILFNAAIVTRSIGGRPGLFSQDNFTTINLATPNEATRVSTSALADAILDGVGSETDLYDSVQADVINGIALYGAGEVISTLSDGINSHFGIVFWAEGDLIAAGHLLSGNRAYFPLKGGFDDLTTDGKLVLTNLINELQLVQTTTGTREGYNTWAAANISVNDPLANPAFDQDGEGDGLSNGLEWILGGDPLAVDAAAVLPTTTGDAVNGLTLVFNRTAASASATLNVSWDNDLETWGNNIPITANIPASGSNPTVSFTGEQATVNIPAANAGPEGKIFARLKAELNP